MNLRLNFSLTQIEYVLAVYRTGHFAKAAKACGVTQPTLSMQIQKLEDSLGMIIFDRSKKPVLLTDFGIKLIEQMQCILTESKKLESLVDAGNTGGIQGEVVLGVIPTIAPYVLPKLLKVILRDFSKIRLVVRELQTHQILECLQNDEIDVGLLATPLNLPKLFEVPLYYEPFYVYCQKEHELSRFKSVKIHALTGQDLWLLEEGHCMRNQALDICKLKKSQPLERNAVFESGSIETLKSIVEECGGYTLVPALAATSHGHKTNLIEFERPIPAREVGLVYRREHHKLQMIESLGDSIIKCIPESVRQLRKRDLAVLAVNK